MTKEYRVNEQIKENVVDVVLSNGKMIKNLDKCRALGIAEEEKLDLVEVSPSRKGSLPICKILDYGKLKYKESKKKKSKDIVTKEVKISLNISSHDLDTKNRQVIKFLSKGNNVKYTLYLKGRERYEIAEAVKKFNNYLTFFVGKSIYNKPKVNGRNISVTIKPC